MNINERKKALEESFKSLIERARTNKNSEYLDAYSKEYDSVITAIENADSIELDILLDYICDVMIYGLYTDDMTADEISSTSSFIESSVFGPVKKAWQST